MKRTHQRQKHENAVGSLATCYFQHTLPLCEQSMSAQVESARFFQISNDRMAVGFRAIKDLLAQYRELDFPRSTAASTDHPTISPVRRHGGGKQGPPPKPPGLPQSEYIRVIALTVNALKKELRLHKADWKDGRKYDLREQLLALLERQHVAPHSRNAPPPPPPPPTSECAEPDGDMLMTGFDAEAEAALAAFKVSVGKLKSPPKVSEDPEMYHTSKPKGRTTKDNSCILSVHESMGTTAEEVLDGLSSPHRASSGDDPLSMDVDSGRKRSRSPPVSIAAKSVTNGTCGKSPLRKFAKILDQNAMTTEPLKDDLEMTMDHDVSHGPVAGEIETQSKPTAPSPRLNATRVLPVAQPALKRSNAVGTDGGHLTSTSNANELRVQYVENLKAEIERKMRSKTKHVPLVRQLPTPTSYEQSLHQLNSSSKTLTDVEKRKEMDAMIRQKVRDQPQKQPPSWQPTATKVQSKVLEAFKKKPGIVIPSLPTAAINATKGATSVLLGQGNASRRSPKMVVPPPPPPPPQPASPASDNYEITDNEQDSDDDEEEERSSTKQTKRVPEWARRSQLGKALELQFVGPTNKKFDPDAFFGQVTTCDLEEVFGACKSRYRRRGSSGNWTMDRLTEQDMHKYQQSLVRGR